MTATRKTASSKQAGTLRKTGLKLRPYYFREQFVDRLIDHQGGQLSTNQTCSGGVEMILKEKPREGWRANSRGKSKTTTTKEYFSSAESSMPNMADVSRIGEAGNKLVRFNTLTNSEGLLTKTIQLDGKGGIVKIPAANMYRGVAEEIELPFPDLGLYLRPLKPNQAIAHDLTGFKQVYKQVYTISADGLRVSTGPHPAGLRYGI